MIKIGKIVNTHGIKGELRILSNSDFKEFRFQPNNKIFIDNQVYIIEDSYYHKNFIIIKLQGFDNINDVEKLKNKDIYGEKLDEQVLQQDEYFNYQLENLKVYNQDNDYLGDVIAIVDGINYNYLRIKGNKKGLIPFNNNYIIKVDLDNKTIIINEIKGLLDEN